MGKLFTYEELATGDVPTQKDFDVAVDMVKEGVGGLVEHGDVVAGKIYGSVMKGTSNPRSDMDVLCILPDDDSYFLVQELFAEVSQKTNVDPEAIMLTAEQALSGQHTIDSLFHHHIVNTPVSNNIPGSSILPLVFRPSQIPSSLVIDKYLIHKLDSLPKRAVSPDMGGMLKAGQRALEAPSNVGRRFLLAHGLFYGMNDGKAEVARVFGEVFAEKPQLIEPFESLYSADLEYTQLVSDFIRGRKYTEIEYNSMLGNIIYEAVPLAISFLRDLREEHYRIVREGGYCTVEGNILGTEVMNR